MNHFLLQAFPAGNTNLTGNLSTLQYLLRATLKKKFTIPVEINWLILGGGG
jgi:hypothetical protein